MQQDSNYFLYFDNLCKHWKMFVQCTPFVTGMILQLTILLLVACESHLSGCFWCFAPKFWEMARTHKSFFCHSMNAGSMIGTLKPYHMLNNLFELIAHKGSGDEKTLGPSAHAYYVDPQFILVMQSYIYNSEIWLTESVRTIIICDCALGSLSTTLNVGDTNPVWIERFSAGRVVKLVLTVAGVAL